MTTTADNLIMKADDLLSMCGGLLADLEVMEDNDHATTLLEDAAELWQTVRDSDESKLAGTIKREAHPPFERTTADAYRNVETGITYLVEEVMADIEALEDDEDALTLIADLVELFQMLWYYDKSKIMERIGLDAFPQLTEASDE